MDFHSYKLAKSIVLHNYTYNFRYIIVIQNLIFIFQGSSRFAQSSNELPGHASEAAGTAATSGTASSTGSGTLAAGTGDIDVAGHASGAATATGSGSAAGAGAGNVAVNLGN